jgi:hypothetical protein
LAVEILAEHGVRKAAVSGKASNALAANRLLQADWKLVNFLGIRLRLIR